jgi:transcriptional regulator with XRE-family HTH domain
MDRKSFGKLLAALRAESNWTQAELAELVDVDPAVISNIERGTKKNIEPGLLFKLANVLNLTTLERREFFLASSGLDETHIVRPEDGGAVTTDVFDAKKVLDRLNEIVGKLRIPACLMDVYCDVLSANRIMLELLQVSPEIIAQAPLIPGGYSSLRVACGDLLRTTLPVGYEDFVLASMRTFREVSLRYRARPYFQYLMREFRNPKKYPWFERTWRKASLLDDDKAMSVDSISFRHLSYGQLTYYSTSAVTFTPYGELFLIQYLSADAQTSAVFEQLADTLGTETVHFAPWPEKKMV